MDDADATPFDADAGSLAPGDRLTALMLGKTLAATYSEVLDEPLPERLEALIGSLKAVGEPGPGGT